MGKIKRNRKTRIRRMEGRREKENVKRKESIRKVIKNYLKFTQQKRERRNRIIKIIGSKINRRVKVKRSKK